MNQTNKIAIVVKSSLQDWQKLNVVSFLASSVAIHIPETRGQAFVTASNMSYMPFINMPILIYKADSDFDLKRYAGWFTGSKNNKPKNRRWRLG